METAVKTSPRVMPTFARHSETYAKPKTARDFDDDFFISRISNALLISKIEEMMQSESVDRLEVLEALYNCKKRKDLEELYEDLCLGRLMEERINEPSESMDDVMDFLRQR